MNFSYTDIEVPEGIFKISPSGISKFFEFPSIWYADNFLGEESFTGNTSSYLGTIIHAIAEAYTKDESTSKEEIEEFLNTIDDPNVNCNDIRANYPEMAMVLINEYLSKNRPNKVEQSILAPVSEKVMVGGTYDAIQGNTLIDYKTAARKPNVETMPFGYKIQLLAYAWILKQQGTIIDRLRLVYIIRATKTLPARVFVVNHMITPEDWQLVDDTLKLMAETIELHQSNPEYTHLLYKSMKLKGK